MTHIIDSKRRKNRNVCMIAYRSLPKDANRMKIARTLQDNGYDVDFIGLKYENTPSIETVNRVNIMKVAKESKSNNFIRVYLDHIIFTINAFFKIFSLNRSKKYSYFHVHNPPDYLILAAIPFKMVYCSRIVLDLHDMFPEAVESNLQFKGSSVLIKVAEIIEKSAIYFSDAIIATNSYDKKIIASRNHVDPDKIFVVMNTPSLQQYSIETASKENYGYENKFIILFEGTIWKRKGIQTVIDAVNLLKDTIPVYLLIVGDGPFVQYLKGMVNARNLNDFIKFTGWVDLSELSKYISIADVCVVPFLKTKVTDRSVPNKLFDYTIQEKPIIASRLKGMAFTFSNKEILFYESGNADDLAKKVRWCFENPKETEKMSINSKKRCRNEYSWDKMEKTLCKCYEALY